MIARRSATLVMPVVLALNLAACGDGAEEDASGTTTTTAPGVTTTTGVVPRPGVDDTAPHR